ncbi:MAG TPA: 50S ribosomal protein L29 [Clostridiales bacterium]|jgi:large subunit ribosomal protein L29|nr:50S ribosomal protein L29 [Clostridiales bacterium]
MKVSEFTSMKPEELTAKIAELKSELFNLRFRLATGQLENTMQITAVKRDIARALTVQTQALKKKA